MSRHTQWVVFALAAVLFIAGVSGPAWAAADYGAPTISAFSLPAGSTTPQVPVTALTAADNVGGSGVAGYCLTESSQQVQEVGRKTIAVTLFVNNVPGNVRIGLFSADIVLPAGVTPLKMAVSDGTALDVAGSVTMLQGGTVQASYQDNTLQFAAFGSFAGGNVLTIALSAPAAMAYSPSGADFSAVTIVDGSLNDIVGAGVQTFNAENTTQCPAWSVSAPESYTFSGIDHQAVDYPRTLYAFVKDAAGNVSAPSSASTVINMPDAVIPQISAFLLPATGTTAQINILGFTATDNVAVTGYCLVESNSSAACSWSSSVPASYTFSGLSQGVAADRTLYAFVKDAANNVSPVATASIVITIPDTTAPAITGFSLPGTSTTADVPLTFTASDNVGVTGYCFVDRNNAAGCNWVGTLPAVYSFSGITQQGVNYPRTLYAFVRDAAGNVSASRSAATVINVPDSVPPTIGAFSVPAAATTATVPITAWLASDNNAVTGYCIAETDSTSACGWSGQKPTSHTFAGLTDGRYEKQLYAFVRDAVGNLSVSASAAVTITIDTTAPALVVSTLSDGSYTNNKSLNVSGTVSDATSGLASFTVNGKDVPVDGAGTFSTTVLLDAGRNRLIAIAVDNQGSQTVDERFITYDDTLPKLIVSTPADNSATNQSLLDITGSIDELSTVVVSVNKGSYQAAQTNGISFLTTVTLAQGTNTVEIVATDLAGNKNSVKRTVVYDPNSPALSLSDPAEDTTVRDAAITISGTVASLSTVGVTISVGGSEYTPPVTNGSFSQPVILAAEGFYTVVVTASNDLGASSSVTRNINYTRGRISINRGAGYTASTKVEAGVDYYPPGSAASMQFYYNNKSWSKPVAYQTSAATPLTLPPGEGVKTVSVRFLDGGGNLLGTYSASIVLDTKAPLGTISIDGGTPVTGDPNVQLALAVSDANRVTGMQLLSDGSSDWPTVWAPYSSTASVQLPAGDGSKTVSVRFRDAAGNVSKVYSDAIVFLSGWSEPQAVDGFMVINGGEQTTSRGSVLLTLADPGNSAVMSFSTDGSTWSKWEAFKTAKRLNLPSGDGLKSVYGRFADSSLQTDGTVYRARIILDSKAPLGGISINSGAYATTSPEVQLALSAADVNGATEMLVAYDQAVTPAWEPFAATKRVTLPAGNGTKKVSVKFRDAAGKVSSSYSASIVLQTGP